ncbi:hypothetical protein GOBAR_AA15484 [Gossypium barbadense]|uniref:X8 domain-containing protein n=1 Tax=Gossypium barbadense TaxID=3634 RepID=A0A2P5XPC2_GOSBA|nr:hypothetical protein GOBAR_AA15484 [Gossypium barbadense]
MAIPVLKLVLLLLPLLINVFSFVQGQTWCVARSDASSQALQNALDYACASGADCTPIQSNGLCFLPNTIQAHASYAYNSYYQRRAKAPGSCDFAGTATVAKTDPSYGSCMYPSPQRWDFFNRWMGTLFLKDIQQSKNTPQVMKFPAHPEGQLCRNQGRGTIRMCQLRQPHQSMAEVAVRGSITLDSALHFSLELHLIVQSTQAQCLSCSYLFYHLFCIQYGAF